MLVLASCHQMRTRTTMAHMAMVYRRPAGAMRQSVKPQLASWDRAGHPSQVKLARFLAHVDAIAGPVLATVSSRVAAELIVGFSDGVSLIDGGHDLVNYLFPVAQRLGPERVAAVFGRKICGPSTRGGTHPPLAGRRGQRASQRAARALTPGVSGSALLASRAVNLWHLDAHRMAAAVAHFAPGIHVIDQDTRPAG